MAANEFNDEETRDQLIKEADLPLSVRLYKKGNAGVNAQLSKAILSKNQKEKESLPKLSRANPKKDVSRLSVSGMLSEIELLKANRDRADISEISGLYNIEEEPSNSNPKSLIEESKVDLRRKRVNQMEEESKEERKTQNIKEVIQE